MEKLFSSEAFFAWICGPVDMPFPDKNTVAPPIPEQIKRHETDAMLRRCLAKDCAASSIALPTPPKPKPKEGNSTK